MLSIMSERIHDGRFLQMIDRMLKAGYLEYWRWHPTFSGAPQGGVASPILSNIYLDRFDRFVEQQLIPKYNLGKRRREYPRQGPSEKGLVTGTSLAAYPTARRVREAARGNPTDGDIGRAPRVDLTHGAVTRSQFLWRSAARASRRLPHVSKSTVSVSETAKVWQVRT